MKLFIWPRASDVTENWHPEAGLVVVAEDLEDARDYMRGHKYVGTTSDAFTTDPFFTFELAEDRERMCIVFPDSGCC